ncbi:endonuclease/exonuclease/phosphatase family protein [Phragmitibacter flavus]|nr:endonuclease/exonuclease/phosphatase family protein [Phragmitibacter flavus]
MLLGVIWCTSIQSSHAIVVGSYNIRYDNSKDETNGNGWAQRASVIASLIRFHQFDILGSQEALKHQVDQLQSLLPAFAHSGCGRDDGQNEGEFAAIFYRKDLFTLKDGGTFWLSETPEKPSIGWDAKFMRICTWVKLDNIKTGRTLFVFNTHFDHHGTIARVESARLLVRSVQAIAKDQPVVLTGDFNADQTSEGYLILHGVDLLRDAFATAEEKYVLNGTANGFQIANFTDRRIDHIFHTRDFKVSRYGVLTDSYRVSTGDEREVTSTAFPVEVKFKNVEARIPSDHFPILVELD